MSVRSVKKSGPAWGVVLAALASASVPGMAGAQNLLKNGSFERYNLDIIFGGHTTFSGFDATVLAPWTIPAGHDVELYVPFFPSGINSINRVPHCHDVIGMDFLSPSAGRIIQSFTTSYPPSQLGSYIYFADIAGDRAKAHTAADQASVGTQLKLGTLPASNNWANAPWPVGPNPNTTANSVFYPRALPHHVNASSALAGSLEMWDNTDKGILVDAAHLFPLYFDDIACDSSFGLGFAGFSILEDGLDGAPWTATTPSNPWHDLKYSTSTGCSCAVDGDHITMHSGCNNGSTMLVAAWDQHTGSGARTTLEFSIEANSVGSSYAPVFTVQFYDWVNLRWVGPSAPLGNPVGNGPYPGAKLTATPTCYKVDFDSYQPKYLTVPLANFVSTAANGTFGPWGLVLAKVQFANGCGSNVCIGQWPVPPTQPWTIDVHYLNITAK